MELPDTEPADAHKFALPFILNVPELLAESSGSSGGTNKGAT
ncbi:hypothetical protein PF005_g19445 [Phytophthora fragariae]|nr:hypothetical protein PF003_g24530 [Phytophthora fragariae]KAE8982513.1 hypothetical protein PR002_g23510 [Phytophthora rubi]KAE8929653.1 hypothetical protein PF009_g20233 [Phytophthora fragariae]KAE8984537.1 hypothetical protein PR001_g23143 [Phytophthora rubi]KAE8991695.1 hypothetical protein PF011_g17842 [Phytophthora fragariae]